MRNGLWIKGLVFGIICLFVGMSIIPYANSTKQILDNIKKQSETSEQNIDDWYWLKSYSNYAPNGMPDFDEKQQDSWLRGKDDRPLFCGACAVANVFWWFDSKHENQSGVPGDGEDLYPLVQDWYAPPPPVPGPYSDDHNFNNVNDNRTPFNEYRRGGELIERIGWYTSRFIFYPVIYNLHLDGVFDLLPMIFGTKRFIRDAGLQNNYTVRFIIKPSFSEINTYVRNNNTAVILVMGNYVSEHKPFPIFSWGHYVAIAGINSSGQIAFSDSIRDDVNPSLNPIEHNDASIVSHDIWNVSNDTPAPRISSFWLPEYQINSTVIVHGAIVISENKPCNGS